MSYCLCKAVKHEDCVYVEPEEFAVKLQSHHCASPTHCYVCKQPVVKEPVKDWSRHTVQASRSLPGRWFIAEDDLQGDDMQDKFIVALGPFSDKESAEAYLQVAHLPERVRTAALKTWRSQQT